MLVISAEQFGQFMAGNHNAVTSSPREPPLPVERGRAKTVSLPLVPGYSASSRSTCDLFNFCASRQDAFAIWGPGIVFQVGVHVRQRLRPILHFDVDVCEGQPGI